MQTELDKLIVKRNKAQQQVEKARQKKGPKVYRAEQQAKVQQSGGLRNSHTLGLLSPLALLQTLYALLRDLRRYGDWPYVLLVLVGLRAYRKVQDENAMLRRREEWQKLTKG